MIQRFILLFFLSGILYSQKIDSIAIRVQLNPETKTLHIEQDFILFNHSSKVLTGYYLHAWANAYSGRNTVLNKTKIEDRKSSLYFANSYEKGELLNLKVNGNLFNDVEFKKNEFVYLNLKKPLAPNKSIHFTASYSVKLPHEKISRYGYYNNGDFLLKYFFLEPAPMKNNRWILQNFKDFEAVAALPTNYAVRFEPISGYHIYSDLNKNGGVWIGKEIDHFRFYLTQDPKSSISCDCTDSHQKTKVDVGYDFDEDLEDNSERLVKEQIEFLQERLGNVPQNHLFISYKTKKEHNYFGIDDIDAWIVKLKLFTKEQKTSLKLFQPLSYEYVDRLFVSDKRNDHWIKNGLQTYLQMRYVDEKFPDLKLAGNVADSLKILGIKPLKYFYSTKLEMNDRYKLLYLFTARQNYDQAIDVPIDELSNLNQLAISSFKSGMSFYYLSEFLGENHFDYLIRSFSEKFKGKLVTKDDFRNFMILNAKKDITWFFDDYIGGREKINFSLKKTKDLNEDSIQIKIKNHTEFAGPFKIIALNNDSIINEQWYSSNQKNITVPFKKDDYDKLIINPGYLFPEIKDRDNYLKTKGLFKNGKKLSLKLYNDIENPEYNQIFVIPQFRWNNYDKFLIGLNFRNSTIITRQFKYSISPRYSTGTNSLTGKFNLSYSLFPQEGMFRRIRFGGGYNYEHYAEDLAVSQWSAFSSLQFYKPFRSDFNHGISFSFNDLDREVEPGEIQTNEDNYSLWNLTYFFNNRKIIHDVEGQISLQTTEEFSKAYSEFYYRWQIFKNYRIGTRLFAGKFVRNETDTDFFNFGTNFITDYTFSYSLLGRSEREGLLSQQFVLAEGGFKSDFDILVNDWILATNYEIPVWKNFDIFVDVGLYGNKGESAQFLYDAGIRVRVIPDFLELFFPIQSTLGFEPSLESYASRIRFTLNLNLARVIAYVRRGKF